HLLGVRHLVFAINKMDLVGDDAAVFERIRSDIEAFLPRLGVSGAHFVPISALRGDMVVERGDALGWYAGPTLLELLESLPVGSELDELPLRLPVQLVIREGAGADFRGYAGRIEAGTLGVGDEVLALPSGRRTRVREIRQLDRRIARARSGDSVLITLADELDVSRGDLFADPADPPIQGQRLWATVCWLDDAPLQPQAAYLLKQTTRTVRARIDSIAERLDVNTLDKVPADSAAVNDIVGLSLKTAQPLIHDDYARIRATGAFILIDEATHRTVAAGMIRG
ncbi:MAG: sulfate adenylyltransferase, partial [Burkholderiaceae bacterium]